MMWRDAAESQRLHVWVERHLQMQGGAEELLPHGEALKAETLHGLM